MRAVLYCRVSYSEQVENLSLPTQEKACREYAARNGYAVDAVFVDRGESAKTTARPEFQAMLTHCRKQRGKVHAVVVYGLSRFSRNSADHHAIAALLRGQGIALRSVTEPIDDSPSGRLMEGILASMAQFDNDLKADRTRVGMKAAAERGRWCWQAPLGYRNGSPKRGEPSLLPHPDAAPLLIRAFSALAASDRTIADVARELQAAGLTARGGRAVSLETLHRAVRNPVYYGRLRSPSMGIDQAGDWMPLVSEDVWDRVQARLGLDGRAARRDAAHPDFPLRGFARCAACRRPLSGCWSRGKMGVRYAYYRCPKNCHGILVARQALDAAFLDLLERLRPASAWLTLVRQTAVLNWRAELDAAVAQRTRLEGQRTTIETRLRRLEDAYLFEHAIDQETFTRRRDELRQDRADALMALEAASITAIDIEGELAQAQDAIERAAGLWRMAPTAEARRRLQHAVLPDGVVWDGVALANSGNRWGCFELPAIQEGESHMASPILPTANVMQAWRVAFAAYRAAS